ncbi:DUF4856 domain-containing protein [Mucilaginibacter sp. SMC90]|uniref:DUF4856 domain-containing protein n=1 Tax=Mucilaginibacter sp. SMC90 TaxID=2929803 RepID=UPI001FB40D3F|nr:DUF4856 domain-containing protein [Mucilaginibacter sp. SMC90]UOE46249.1 DUF4856 domain-containing protein [Mucilaginibacter sp. SMC90]
MKNNFTTLGAVALSLLVVAGCKKSDDKADAPIAYDIPTTYNFSNANFADATTRLGMITEIQNVEKVATTGTVDAQKAKNMFANSSSPFVTAAYNTSGLQLKDQTAASFQTDVLRFIDTLTAVSQTGKPAARGVAGVGTSSANAATKYALTANGMNYAQVFNKTIMGGLITFQIVNVMNAANGGTIDNTTVTNGSTALEHAWDLAFGYWGVPIDFPTNKTNPKPVLWGSYSTQVDSGFHANKILMDAFLKGRAAISHKDTKTIQAQSTIILQAMERLTGAAALQEVKEVKESINDNIARNSRLSECYGFIYSLKYNPKRVITDAQIDALLALFPKNFYDLTLDQLNAIRDAVAKQYDFDNVKDIL